MLFESTESNQSLLWRIIGYLNQLLCFGQNKFGFLFNCKTEGQASDTMTTLT